MNPARRDYQRGYKAGQRGKMLTDLLPDGDNRATRKGWLAGVTWLWRKTHQLSTSRQHAKEQGGLRCQA